jgi:hypothetical protein
MVEELGISIMRVLASRFGILECIHNSKCKGLIQCPDLNSNCKILFTITERYEMSFVYISVSLYCTCRILSLVLANPSVRFIDLRSLISPASLEKYQVPQKRRSKP